MPNHFVARNLRDEFQQVLEKNAHVPAEDVIEAAFNIIASVVFSIRCPGCRKASKKSIEKELSAMLRTVLIDAAARDRADPSPQEHLH